MVSSIVLYTTVLMFPRTYWFLFTGTLRIAYSAVKMTPYLIKKIIEKKDSYALEVSESQDDPTVKDKLCAS